LYYGADIFKQDLDFGKEDILAQQMLLASENLIFTFIAMFTVDKLGRNYWWIWNACRVFKNGIYFVL